MADQMGVTPPPPMGGPPPGAMMNTSGQPGAVLPPELQGWNWGGFLMGWIWSIAHSAWLGFVLCFFLGIIGNIVQGIKGNEWAWQNRRWESIEQFKATQRVWAIWGVVILAVAIVIWILAIVIGGVLGAGAARSAMGG